MIMPLSDSLSDSLSDVLSDSLSNSGTPSSLLSCSHSASSSWLSDTSICGAATIPCASKTMVQCTFSGGKSTLVMMACSQRSPTSRYMSSVALHVAVMSVNAMSDLTFCASAACCWACKSQSVVSMSSCCSVLSHCALLFVVVGLISASWCSPVCH